jgi:hypothetical protein
MVMSISDLAMMIDTISTTETLFKIYQTTQYNILQDSHL